MIDEDRENDVLNFADEIRIAPGTRRPDPRAAERIAHAGSGQVPVRIISPKKGQARAAYLQIQGGSFYMDSAARSDTRNSLFADAGESLW